METVYSIDANIKYHFCSYGKSRTLVKVFIQGIPLKSDLQEKIERPLSCQAVHEALPKNQGNRTESFFFFFFCLLVLNKWCYMLQISLWLVAVTEVEPKPQCMSVDTICILFIVNQFPQLLFSPGYNDVNLSTFFFLKQQVRSLMLLNRTDGHQKNVRIRTRISSY